MPIRPTRPLRLAALLGLAALGPARSGAPAESPVVLWTWERAEDLRFLSSPAARQRRSEGPSGGWLGLYPNCLDDAFETALATLAARTQTWGAGSVWIREWLAGQSAVFANCGGGESTPSEPRDGWPELLTQDRRYQIAATHLYSDRWASARSRFAEIGRDAGSPWAPLARYLIRRAELRLGRFEDAVATFDAILADPEGSRWHVSARVLRSGGGLPAGALGRRLSRRRDALPRRPRGDPGPDRLALPAFLRATERPEPASSRARGFDEAGVVLLGRRVLEYADARREDPRVPEALHLVVRATRRAPPCPEADHGAVSRGAFERLHRRYPDSEWTAKTPYWFDG